jgi:hypothetical protein
VFLQTRISGYTRGGIRCLGGVIVIVPTNTDPLIYQRWDQVPIGGVSIPTNMDPWIYQRWDQVHRRSKHPYKHGPLDIPEVGLGV